MFGADATAGRFRIDPATNGPHRAQYSVALTLKRSRMAPKQNRASGQCENQRPAMESGWKAIRIHEHDREWYRAFYSTMPHRQKIRKIPG
jgi:hypothetical protein